MSKGLNSLSEMVVHLNNKYAKTRQALEDFRNIKKELEALEIIKKYITIDVLTDNDGELFMYSIRDKQYISSRSCKVMNDEEYKILKEVLKNDC